MRVRRYTIQPTVEMFEVFAQAVDIGRPCWLWTGGLNRMGYGWLYFRGKSYLAHRVSHAFFLGPLDASLAVDHMCGNRCCVNPEHLEQVTYRENIVRHWTRSRPCEHERHPLFQFCGLCAANWIAAAPHGVSGYHSNKAWRKRHPDTWRESKRRYYEQSNRWARQNGEEWSTRDEESVLAHSVTDRELSKLLGRSVRAIQIKRAKLKVAATPGFFFRDKNGSK